MDDLRVVAGWGGGAGCELLDASFWLLADGCGLWDKVRGITEKVKGAKK